MGALGLYKVQLLPIRTLNHILHLISICQNIRTQSFLCVFCTYMCIFVFVFAKILAFFVFIFENYFHNWEKSSTFAADFNQDMLLCISIVPSIQRY